MATQKKTRFTVAFNGDDNLIAAIAKFQEVDSIFGKVSKDVVGGGRPTSALADISFDKLKNSINIAHQHNLKFNYLLNSACMANQELSRKTNNRIIRLLDIIVNAGADGVVVTIPYLLNLIKKRYPNLKVLISTFAGIDSPQRARIWEDNGADRLILDQNLNRNKIMLEKIRKSVKCELEVFVNVMCMFKCPFCFAHSTSIGHLSSTADPLKGFGVDYYSYRCTLRRLQDPVELIRGRFIRPEDIGVYEDIGIDVFKISDRLRGTPWIIRAVEAYTSRQYEGNLADIIAYPIFHAQEETLINNPSRFLARSNHISHLLLETMKGLKYCILPFHIDNRKLDGFLEHFFQHNCEYSACGIDCHYCESVAMQAVTILPKEHKQCLSHVEQICEMLEDRRAFAKDNPIFKLIIFMIRILSRRKNNFGKAQPNPGNPGNLSLDKTIGLTNKGQWESESIE
jgi:collagenase-like PrtC family protease